MKILAVGDIVGENGLNKLKEILPNLKQREKIDFVIVNGENVAGGMGITEKHFKQIIFAGADVVTLGNHTWSKKDVFNILDNEKLLRPANYPKGVVGKGYNIYNCKNKKIAVINLIGRTNMGILSENPFLEAEGIIEKIKDKADYIVIDFHAEATAEKIALAHYLDGKVTIIFGTHTHVQTADEYILPKGTAYITDIGMTGPIESVIGMDKKASIKRFVTTLPEKYKIAEGESKFNSCLFELDDETGRIDKITRINM
jgi:metallophosphoesterase (TIGR00282 family)